MNEILIGLIGLISGATAGFWLFYKKQKEKEKKAKYRASTLIKEAEKKARFIQREAERQSDQLRTKVKNQADRDAKENNQILERKEREIGDRLIELESNKTALLERDALLCEKIADAKRLKEQQEQVLQELIQNLEKVSQMTQKEAQDVFMTNVERESKSRAGALIKELEDQARRVANRKAKEIVLDAIQKTAVEHTVENTTATVTLPDDEMKGRIIGKEGRNIRSFESSTGVDVIIDDTPNTIILSSFDPIRREIARLTMDKLVADGRIHPTRIEDSVALSKKELQDIIIERGERAADELGLQFHSKIIELIGKLHYRTSYGQNILAHSLESAHIAGQMATALGVNVKLAKRGAMLHDIGKALDFDHDGTHDDLGADICRKYGESDELINCIMAHHEGEVADTIEAVIVMVSDAISSVRPGARKESTELYIKRLQGLESIASSFEGVERAYAIQAGREIRVLVRPQDVNDDKMYKLAQDIAKKVELEMDYPGQVKVSLVRETRAVGLAK